MSEHQPEKNTTNQDTVSNKKEPMINYVIKIGAGVLGLLLVKFMGLGAILLIICGVIGMGFSKWYIKKGKINKTLVNVILWVNVITWVIPFLGLLTGFATLGFSEHFTSQKKKFMILAIFAIVLALVNGIIGAVQV